MFEIDKERFGAFLSELRKQKGITQKELAQKLFISDKAVSEWERGLSMPDIALLIPLSNILGVTVSELLECQRIDSTKQIDVKHIDELVAKTIKLSEEKQKIDQQQRVKKGYILFAAVIIVILEIALLYRLGYTTSQLTDNLLMVELLFILYGGWACLFAKEQLPVYYDENKITTYSDGFFKMSVLGISFNNNNWPHIISVLRTWTIATLVIFPLLYWAISWFLPTVWVLGRIFFISASIFSMFVPLYIVGRKYQ